jgi:hypothetical protein
VVLPPRLSPLSSLFRPVQVITFVDLQNNRTARICRIKKIKWDWSDQYTDDVNDGYCFDVRSVSVEPHSCAS